MGGAFVTHRPDGTQKNISGYKNSSVSLGAKRFTASERLLIPAKKKINNLATNACALRQPESTQDRTLKIVILNQGVNFMTAKLVMHAFNLLVISYLIYSLKSGKVWTQTWVRRKWVSYSRQKQPNQFWFAIALYVVMVIFAYYLIFARL